MSEKALSHCVVRILDEDFRLFLFLLNSTGRPCAVERDEFSSEAMGYAKLVGNRCFAVDNIPDNYFHTTCVCRHWPTSQHANSLARGRDRKALFGDQ